MLVFNFFFDMDTAGDGGAGGGAPAGDGGGSATGGTAGAAGAAGAPPAAGASPAGGGKAGVVTPAGGDPAAVVPLPYAPKGKYKVGREEKDFPPWMLAAIKEEGHEKELRELYERGHGIESVKQSRDRLATEKQQATQQFTELATDVQRAYGFAEKKDFDSFFDMLDIPVRDILEYAVRKVNETPEQAEAAKAARERDQQVSQTTTEAEQLRTQLSQQTAQMRTMELRTELGHADVAPMVQAFDEANGENAFWQECVNRGRMHLAAGNGDKSATDIVKEVVKLFGSAYGKAPAQAASATDGGAPAGDGGAPAARQKPKVIPVVKGGNASPVHTHPKSIDDLKRIHKERASANG